MPKILKPKKPRRKAGQVKNNLPTIAVIGFGRFGRFWAKTLTAVGRVWVVSGHAGPSEVKKVGAELVSLEKAGTADFIFVAVAISDTEAMIKKLAPQVLPGSLVMDVCSVKVMPAKWLKKYLPASVSIVATHPMFGPDSGKNGVAGLQIVLCPLRVLPKQYLALKKMFNSLKLKIVETTAVDHDKQTAFSLALVHYLGRVLGGVDFDKIKITTLGFNRLKEMRQNVLNDSEQLFLDFYHYNPYAKKALSKLKQAEAVIDKLVTRQ